MNKPEIVGYRVTLNFDGIRVASLPEDQLRCALLYIEELEQKLQQHSVMQAEGSAFIEYLSANYGIEISDMITQDFLKHRAVEAAVGQRSVGTVAEAWVATPKPKPPLSKRLENLIKKIRARKSSEEQP